MSGIVNSTGAKSGVIGTTVGTPAGVAGTGYFLAAGDGNSFVQVTTGQKVAFSHEAIDDDNLYDTSAYDYTAPATGVYLFCAVLFTGDSDLTNAFEFRIDDARLTGAASGGEILGVNHEGNSSNRTMNMIQALKLTSGQAVSVTSQIGASQYYPYQSHWWGYRLK